MSKASLLLTLAVAAATVLAGCVTPPADTDTPAEADTEVPSLLGGTAGVVHHAGGLAADAALAAGLPAAEGVQLSIGADATEPTLGVTKEGVIFMTGFQNGGATGRSMPTIYRSLDNGSTWEDVGPKLPTGDGAPPVTNDPYVWVDVDTGRVFDIDLYALVCDFISFSDDLGETWTTNPFACGLPPGGHDHQTLTTGKPRTLTPVGYPNLVYYCVNRVADSACATSLNGGISFGPLVPVYQGVGTSEGNEGSVCGGLTGHVKTGPDGKVFLPRAWCGGIPTVAVSEDDGLTWTIHTISREVPVYGHEVSIAVDEENGVHAFWLGRDGLPYLASSADGGATWTPARPVQAPGVTATEFPAIAAGKKGHVAFAYIGSTIEGGYEGKPTGVGGLMGDIMGEPEPTEWDNATWNGYVGVVTDAFADNLTVVTVSTNDPADPLARGLCGRTRCGGMNDFIDIVVDSEGRPWAAFVDVCTAECVTDPTVKKDEPVGFVGTLVTGPALRGEAPALLELGLAPAEEEEGEEADEGLAGVGVKQVAG